MFVLAELEYIIRVEPRRFGKDMKREVRDELNRKFANKVAHPLNKPSLCVCVSHCMLSQVLHSVGLCIALYDITRVGDSYILPGDGASHTKGGTPPPPQGDVDICVVYIVKPPQKDASDTSL